MCTIKNIINYEKSAILGNIYSVAGIKTIFLQFLLCNINKKME